MTPAALCLVAAGLASCLRPRVAIALLALWLTALTLVTSSRADVPPAAKGYQRTMLAESRAVFGLNAPVAVFAGQVEQESAWQADACSAFACGLAQFTPDTAQWISGVYQGDLGHADVFNPAWAIRALLRYDRRLFDGNPGATDCDRWAFTLASYNGGPGWTARDRSLCAAAGCDPTRWFGAVEHFTARAAAAAVENRRYPRRILGVTQFHYAEWGRTVSCPI